MAETLTTNQAANFWPWKLGSDLSRNNAVEKESPMVK